MSHRWLAYCILGLSLHSALADFAIYISNASDSTIAANAGQNTVVEYNGVPLYAWGAHASIAPGAYITRNVSGETAGGTIRLIWPNSSGSNLVINPSLSTPGATAVGDTGWVAQNFSGNVGHYVFDVGGAGAATPEYRFDLVLRNDTYVSQPYSVLTNGVLAQSATISPGGTLALSYTEVEVLFPVSISNGGVYPPFVASFAATPGLYWTPQDDIPIPETVAHVMLGNYYTPTNSLDYASNLFAGQPGGTNAATDGTVQKGFAAMLGAQKEGREEQSGLLRQIATNTANAAPRLPTEAEVNAVSNANWNAIENTQSGFTMGATVGNYGAGGTVPTMSWEMDFGLATVDLNPLSNDFIAPYASPIRNLIIWSSAIGLVILCGKRFSEMIGDLAATSQASGPHLSILGTGGNIITAAIVAAILLAMLAGAAVLWVNFQSANSTIFAAVGIDPMEYIPKIEPLLAFFPLDVVLAHFAIGLSFWLGLTATKWILIVGIKIIPR